jgi:hypothetical protein
VGEYTNSISWVQCTPNHDKETWKWQEDLRFDIKQLLSKSGDIPQFDENYLYITLWKHTRQCNNTYEGDKNILHEEHFHKSHN